MMSVSRSEDVNGTRTKAAWRLPGRARRSPRRLVAHLRAHTSHTTPSTNDGSRVRSFDRQQALQIVGKSTGGGKAARNEKRANIRATGVVQYASAS
jgi:hypothetical protein